MLVRNTPYLLLFDLSRVCLALMGHDRDGYGVLVLVLVLVLILEL